MAVRYKMSAKVQAPVAKWSVPAVPATKPPAIKAGIRLPGTAQPGGAAVSTTATSTQPAGGSSLPLDPILEADIGAAHRTHDRTTQELAAERGGLGDTYGFGVTASGSVYDDPTNPYSRAIVMQLLHDRQAAAAGNSMAARGQLYSGAYQTQQDTLASNKSRDRDALIREFLAANGGITRRGIANEDRLSDSETRAKADAITRALAARPDAASVPPYVNPGGVPGYPRNKAVAASIHKAIKNTPWKK